MALDDGSESDFYGGCSSSTSSISSSRYASDADWPSRLQEMRTKYPLYNKEQTHLMSDDTGSNMALSRV